MSLDHEKAGVRGFIAKPRRFCSGAWKLEPWFRIDEAFYGRVRPDPEIPPGRNSRKADL